MPADDDSENDNDRSAHDAGDDRIVKEVLLRAPLARAWAALGDSAQFGAWFGAVFDGPFVVGETLHARIAPTQADAEVAARQAPHAGTPFVVHIVALEPMRRLAFRWHPGMGGDPDDPARPTTLVEFELTETERGVHLRITESGFAALPPAQRRSVLEGNAQGWAMQAHCVANHVQRAG